MQELIKTKTKQIGFEVLKLVDELPNKWSAWIVANQFIRGSTTIRENYRATCRAKFSVDFINKLKIEEETQAELCYLL